MNRRQNTVEFLKQIVGKPVVVKLNSGILSCLDGFMNIALEQTEEYQNGQLKNKYGDAFISEETMFCTSALKSGSLWRDEWLSIIMSIIMLISIVILE